MPDPSPNTELLRSLGKLARGLSAVFWGLPFALVVSVRAARSEWSAPGVFAAVLIFHGLMVFGLWQMSAFQKQERPWTAALDRAKLLGLVNLGLSPFLYWSNRMPAEKFFSIAVIILGVSSLVFLFNLNIVLQRLGAMLPDETLRLETKQFTAINRGLLGSLFGLCFVYGCLLNVPGIPMSVRLTALWFEDYSLYAILLFVLLPLAMTMALIWKTKEVILDSVFSADHHPVNPST
jgi:hypothetical protein